MANARALDKRRKSVRNIRKITRTMELIAQARFKQAMDRAVAASAYTKKIGELVADLAKTGLEVSHPLLEQRDKLNNVTMLVLTGNRGLCGGYNGNVLRAGVPAYKKLRQESEEVRLEVSGKRGVSMLKFQEIIPDETYFHFEDQPKFEEVDVLATRYLDEYATGRLDRLDVAFTRFVSASKQEAVVETLLPLGSLEGADEAETAEDGESQPSASESMYEFLPSAEAILEEVVPASFKARLFKCFLDAAVSEQIARMVAMKAATENAGEMIKQLSMTYNRARQTQITQEIMEVIGGVEALEG